MEAILPPMPLSIWAVILRFLCAMAVGTVIGIEREYSGRPAGMRTHILVALGACAVMLTGQLIFAQYAAYGALPDPARLPAQVITGVGFLGAGTILKEGPTVRGLTTAASLWAVACLGVAAGGGYYAVALVGVVLIFITLTLFEFLQNRFIDTDSTQVTYCVDAPDITAGLDAINDQAAAQGANICGMQTQRTGDGYRILFRADISGFHYRKRRRNFLNGIAAHPAVTSIHVYHKEDIPIA